mgnify:CR=1 FL=1
MEKLDPKGFMPDVDMKAYINQLVNELRSDLEVYEQIKKLNLTVGEVKDNIARLTDYRMDYNYCKNCPGIEKCNKEIPHLSIDLIKEGKFINVTYKPCHKLMEKIRIDSHYLYDDFPQEWKTSSVKTLDLTEKRRPIIKEFLKILNNESSRWIYVIGNHKVGKSFLLVTLANEFVNSNLGTVAIINAPQRIKELADLSYQNKDEFAQTMLALSKVPLLVIDDFGEEYKSEYIRDTIVIPLLSEREHQNLLTFFTSEFSISDIQQMYSIGQASGAIRGKQLARLLKDMATKEYDLSGVSLYRK